MPSVTAAPFVLNKPKVTVGTGGTAIEIQCAASEIHTNVDQSENTVETFCGTFTSFKPETWDVTLNGLQSFGAAGLWNLLRPLVGSLQTFTVLPDRDVAVGAANPQMTGSAIVKAFPFLDAAVGEASEFDLVLAVQGPPQFVTSLVAATGATAGTPGTFTPANAQTPANFAAMTGLTASPTTLWTSGQYVVAGDLSRAYWNATTWVSGTAP